jgi:hypothetical protein
MLCEPWRIVYILSGRTWFVRVKLNFPGCILGFACICSPI